ncbi:MAG: hypothetical protein LC768_13735 [Acidobacteria bacterium]|nr:hypothetical protein [Acidobacteriota bacterium]MCA1639372.1 hypothetical protein [Acidobacteriota bacterium]
MEDMAKSTQLETDGAEGKSEQIESFIRYEEALGKFFKALDLKPNQCQLIRAFVLVSKGKTEFEASFAELAGVFHKRKANKSRPDSTARNAFKGLLKWQKEHQMELVRVLKPGHRVQNDDGTFDCVKSKYEFVILDELVKVLHSNSEDLETVIDQTLTKIKAQYKPVEKTKAYHPRHLLKKAKKTISTKLRKVFELAVQSGVDPAEECQRVLNDSWNIYKELEEDWTEQQNREKYKAGFELLLSSNETSEDVEFAA